MIIVIDMQSREVEYPYGEPEQVRPKKAPPAARYPAEIELRLCLVEETIGPHNSSTPLARHEPGTFHR